jgi:hypothetical protein
VVEGLAEILRVAACVLGVAGLQRELDELGADALDVLLGRGPDVVGLDHRTQPLGGRDRLQPRDARADHEDLGR